MHTHVKVSNEKALVVHNLQKLTKEDKIRVRIAEKSGNQFNADDIHVEVSFTTVYCVNGMISH